MKIFDTDNQSGLTLIELVVVALLVAMMSFMLYGTLAGIIRTRDASDATRAADETAHYVFSRMSSELAGRGFVPLNKVQDEQQSGTQASLSQAYMQGTDQHGGDADQDKLRFVSTNAAQPFVGGPANYGLVEVEYHLAENANSDEYSAAPGEASTMTLVREETPAGTNSKDIINSRRVVLPLAENIVGLNFRYLKNGAWQKDWKETNPPMPEAVEISLKVKANSGKVETYRTAIPITVRQKTEQQQKR